MSHIVGENQVGLFQCILSITVHQTYLSRLVLHFSHLIQNSYDLTIARTDNQVDMRYLINMDYSADLPINSMGRRVRSRLYFTSESHLHSSKLLPIILSSFATVIFLLICSSFCHSVECASLRINERKQRSEPTLGKGTENSCQCK